MRYVLAGVCLVLLLAAIGGLKAWQITTIISAAKAMQAAGPPAEVVSTARSATQEWEQTLTAVGTVVSAEGVVVRNEVPGVVTRLAFDSGQRVHKGDVLVALDPEVEQAQLRATRARLRLAATESTRSSKLFAAGAIPQQKLDADKSALASLSADALQLKEVLNRKVIRAPFDGQLGIREVDVGQVLAVGTRIVTLESVTAANVDFSMPQEELPLLNVGMPVRLGVQAADPSAETGTLVAVDPVVDPATRMVRVRAAVPPQGALLRPGMFVRAAVVLPRRATVVAVPQTAVVHASYGDSVFKVERESRPVRLVARQQFVRLGETRGDFVAVTEGLQAGVEVVSAGAFKLRNGARLAVDNSSVRLQPQLAPRLENR